MNRRLVATLLVGAALGCGRAPAEVDRPGSAGESAGDRSAATRVADSLIVWESNRTGSFKILARSLAGGTERQLSLDEPERDHCCPVISPDGTRVVYLSLPARRGKGMPAESPGSLHLTGAQAGGGDRVLSSSARHDGENRAAIWWSESSLVYLEADGSTRKLDLARGSDELLHRSSGDGSAWLIEPTGRFASSGPPSFSPRDPATGKIRRATPVGGCQPIFTADGELGIWSAGAGGPIDAIELETRATRSIVRRNDTRLPAGRRYIYFPAIAHDRTLLAWAASDGTHDQFRADYDVFVAELDPQTVELVGAPIRITAHPAVDRYPAIWRLARPGSEAVRRAPPAELAAAKSKTAADSGAPVFLWRGATDLNQRSATAESEILDQDGAVWSDRFDRLALGGGFASSEAATAKRIEDAAREANALSVALLVEPAAIGRNAGGPLVTLAASSRHRGFMVRQSGDRIELLLRRAATGPAGGDLIELARLPDSGAHHIAFTFSPGRLTRYLDGRRVAQQIVPGDFFQWKNRALRLGADLWSDERGHAWLSDLLIWDRELEEAEIAAEAKRALARLERQPPLPRLELEARLVARARLPRLDEIAPYRRAMVVEEYEPIGAPVGALPAGPLRVARWALLGGRAAPGSERPLGSRVRLRLEPFAAQPQLDSVVVSDTLPASSGPLYVDVGLDAR